MPRPKKGPIERGDFDRTDWRDLQELLHLDYR